MQRDFWWVVIINRRLLLGPANSEREAYDLGLGQTDEDFKVVSLPTRDKNTASGMVKASILKDTNNLSEALQKMHHKV